MPNGLINKEVWNMSKIELSFNESVSPIEQEKTEMDSDNLKISRFPNLYQRDFGTIVDYIFVFFCAYLIAVKLLPQADDISVQFGIVLLALFLYDSVLTAYSCTLGQLLFRFRIRQRATLQRIPIHLSLVRSVLKLLLGGYSMIAIIFNRERRAVHDYATGSIAISPSDINDKDYNKYHTSQLRRGN